MKKNEKKQPQRAIISPELVEQAKAGDQNAFTELYRLTNVALYRTIRAMVRDEDLAWDIQQDTYLRAFSSLNQLESNEAFLTWVRRIAVNVTATKMAKRLPVTFTELTEEEDALLEQPDDRIEVQPELALDQKETARFVREIFSTLPESQQVILGMRYYEDLSVKEIADLLHLTQGTVKSQLHRGRKKVETQVRVLEQQGVKLYGLSPFAFALALLRQTEPAAASQTRMLNRVLAKSAALSGKAVSVTAKPMGTSFFLSMTGKIAAAALGVALTGAAFFGIKALLNSNGTAPGDVQPTGYSVFLDATDAEPGTVGIESEAQTENPPAESAADTSEDLVLSQETTESATQDTSEDLVRPQETTELPTQEEPAERINLREANLSTDSLYPMRLLELRFFEQGEYKDREDCYYSYSYRIPGILAYTPGAKAINDAIEARWIATVDAELTRIKTQDPVELDTVHYYAHAWEDVLSVVLQGSLRLQDKSCEIFCYDSTTGQRLTTKTLLERRGVSQEAFLAACRSAFEKTFDKLWSNQSEAAKQQEGYAEKRAHLLSDEVINLELMSYLSEVGKLTVVMPLEMPGSQETSFIILPLELAYETDDAEDPQRTSFTKNGDGFTNQRVEIRYHDGCVDCRDLSTGTTSTLFTQEASDSITRSLIGVTEQRLYFSWNEVNDWWGTSVYSVDYQGNHRRDYGGRWDIQFEGGWLILTSFHTDVRPESLRVIDRNDRLVLDMDQYDVWSTELVGDALYYVHLVNSPFASSLIERLQQVARPEDGVDIEILRMDPDNSVTVIGTLHSEYPYVPCCITDGVLAVTEDKQDGSERLTTSYYDLQTLEPILPPDQKN